MTSNGVDRYVLWEWGLCCSRQSDLLWGLGAVLQVDHLFRDCASVFTPFWVHADDAELIGGENITREPMSYVLANTYIFTGMIGLEVGKLNVIRTARRCHIICPQKYKIRLSKTKKTLTYSSKMPISNL